MTYTFDGWDTPQNSLMHFRTKGSKNGVRRFQNEDGSWTPLGLRERKEREGWGETRKERKLQKKIDRAERHQARKEARAEARAAAAEKKRASGIKGLTDEELQKKINRLKMEQEYNELKRSPILKSGEHLFNAIMERNEKKEARQMELNKQAIELERLKTQKTQATEATKKAKYEAAAAKSEAKKMKQDRKGGLAKERKAQLTNAKTNYRNTTIWGAIGKRANNRAKWVQEKRMKDIDSLKAARTAQQMTLNNQREKLQVEKEYWKAEQERHKAGGKKP